MCESQREREKKIFLVLIQQVVQLGPIRQTAEQRWFFSFATGNYQLSTLNIIIKEEKQIPRYYLTSKRLVQCSYMCVNAGGSTLIQRSILLGHK